MSEGRQSRKDPCYEALQADFFADRALVIAANRGPVTFETGEDGSPKSKRGGGGLVTALLGLCEHADATWVACGQTEADALWRAGKVDLPGGNSVWLQFLEPDASAYDGYYNA